MIVSDKETRKDGVKQEEVEFHNVVIWGRQAEVAKQYLQKGSTVLIEGRLHTPAWTDKDGQERRTTEIVCDHLQLGPKPQGAKVEKTERIETQARPEDIETAEQDEIDPEEIPF